MKHYIQSTPSTNTLLSNMIADGRLETVLSENNAERDFFTLFTFDQTAGRGQAGNHWESAKDQNLTFSTLFDMQEIPVENQFVLCEMVPLAIKNVLNRQLDEMQLDVDKVVIKWPNDIYWNDRKLGGILIEHSIFDGKMAYSIAGVGLNINQMEFLSDAPNPVSLAQITGQKFELIPLLDAVIAEFQRLKPLLFQPEKLKQMYMDGLYRSNGYYAYKADGQVFDAKIEDVAPNGLISMRLTTGETRSFAFKQVSYII